MKALAMDADDILSQDANLVNLKVYIPDLFLQKNFQFHKDEFIWDVKQHIIDSLPKELKESFNYGVFCPPINGKAGKFLDEQRPLADYPFQASAGYVELRYKRRVYKMMNVEEKQIKQLHTRANLRRMMEHVNNGQVEKITKMCARGMDPNFHCPESGETPLTFSTTLKQPAKVILALINGGALLDFRTKDGLTALHKAVERNNLEALKTLLDLGASPNYKDSKGLTPLYYTLLHSSDHQLTETLLHDHAMIGTCDPQGWQEVHQACKHGMVQHLEHLLFYGADMNARNASGNTPLHVCAVNDQESCTRVLLFRGADKDALNFANQNPYQVAVIAGNLNLGELIRNHNPEEVVPYREMPRYNPRRRASIAPVATLSRTHSDPRLELNLKPPSPCPSNCSLPPFSSVSCISDTSTGSSSTCTQPSCEDSEDTASGSIHTEKSATSDSSGVCTSNSAASYESGQYFDAFLPGSRCICVADYTAPVPGHLQLCNGDVVEVINEAEDGLILAKTNNGQVGYCPISCMQEIGPRPDNAGYLRVEGRRERCAKRISTVPRRWKTFGEPRTVILHKGKKGFGFVLRGAKASSPLMERQTNVSWPSQYLEDVNKGGVADLAGLKRGDYLLEINGQDVSQASHEHVVSIIQQSGNLVAMTVITLNTPPTEVVATTESVPLPYRQCATLPRKLIDKKAPAPPKRDPKTTLSVGRVRARSMVAGLAEIEALERQSNDYDSEGRSTKSSSVESIPNKTALQKAITSQLTKTASIKARPSSQRVSATELEQFFARQGSKRNYGSYTLNSRLRTSSRPPKVYGSVAEMKRSKAARSKLTDILMKAHKDFSSTPNLKAENENVTVPTNNQTSKKRSLSQEDVHNLQGNRHSWACTTNGYNNYLGLCDNEDYSMNYNEAWKSIEDVYDNSVPPADIYAQTLPLPKKDRASCPPPSYPPPPPPVGQVVKVDVSKALSEYANVNMGNEEKDSNVMSSFRPGDSAKLYAPPEVVVSVGYKSETASVSKDVVLPRRVGKGSSLRSQSLPPKCSVNKSDKGSATSSEAENSGDSGGLYSTFKKTSRQRDSMSTDSGHVSDKGAMWPLKGKPAATSAYSSKFDCEDSDAGSPQNYPTIKTPVHEPFIPEPDYESSEDDFLPTSVDQAGSLSTFGKGEEQKSPRREITITQEEDVVAQLPPPEPPNENEPEPEMPDFEAPPPPPSPHTEAKRAIQEARERLRFSQKPLDKNATVVFISGKITEHKVEKSEIQLHRTEEGRLTGTVVISTNNEPQEPLYLSSSILKNYENDKNGTPRYPSRDAPASEYAKYRQQILSSINQSSSDSLTGAPQNTEPNNIAESDNQPENCDVVKSSEVITPKASFTEELKITLTGAQKLPPKIPTNTTTESKPNTSSHSEELSKEEVIENSSSAVTDNEMPHSEPMSVLSSSTEEDSKADTVVHLPESGHISESQITNQSKSDKYYENRSTYKTEEVLHTRQRSESFGKRSAKEVANSLANELQGLRHTLESKRHSDRGHRVEHLSTGSKSAQAKDKKHSVSPSRQRRQASDHHGKSHSSTEKSLEESLECLKLQVSSLGLTSVNDSEVFTELVPPPPEFAAATEHARREAYTSSEIAIAPPPEFSDNSPQLRNRAPHRSSSSSHQRKNCSVSCHLNAASNTLDLNFLASLRSKSPNIMQMIPKEKKSRSSTVHLPCTSGLRHLPSYHPSEHLHESTYSELTRLKSVQKEFRFKLLQEWTPNDIADWLDSLFLPEYKQRFSEAGITGAKLANMDSNDLMGLGVKQMGHRLNMERSLKRYLK